MFPDLFQATKEYWQQLDRIESLYQQGQMSIEEVDQEVQKLMEQLGRKRRESLDFWLKSCLNFISTQREMVIGLVFIFAFVYIWMFTMTA